MLFVQSINLYYCKNVRYPNYAQMRNSIKFLPINLKPNKFYPREINSDTMLDCEVLLQTLAYWQTTDGLKLYGEKFRKFGNEIFTEGKYNTYWNYHNLIANIRIFKEDDLYKIMFCDEDFYSHRPTLHGHNESYHKKKSPFRYKDRIYETAFRLHKNEYGRIIYNKRYVDHDTGQWYYGLHTYNIISCDKQEFKEKMFFRKITDYEYRQLKKLF